MQIGEGTSAVNQLKPVPFSRGLVRPSPACQAVMQADFDSLVRSSLVYLRKVSLPGLDLHHAILHTTIRNQTQRYCFRHRTTSWSFSTRFWPDFLCA